MTIDDTTLTLSDTQSHTLQRSIPRTPTHSPTHSHTQLRSPISPPHSSTHVPRTPPKQCKLTLAMLGRINLCSRPTHSHTQLPPSHSSLITKQSCSRKIIAATHYAAIIARPTHKSHDARFAAATLVAHRTALLTSHAHRQGKAGSRLPCVGGFCSAHVLRTPSHGYAVQYPHRAALLTSHTQISAHVHRTIHAFSYELFAHH